MPIYAQIICIGGNAVFALLFALAGFMGLGQGDTSLAVFLLLMAAAALYTLWVLLKFRRYLGAEQALEREAHIAELQKKIDALHAAQPQATGPVEASTDGDRPA